MHCRERAPQQPRDVHLRNAELGRDLRLRQPVEEAQDDDPALPLVELLEPCADNRTVLEGLVTGLVFAKQIDQGELSTRVDRN